MNNIVNKIHHADCLEFLPNIPDESIDCIIADVPYGINYHSNYYTLTNPHKPIINDDKLFFPVDELWRVLKSTGCMFVFYSHKKPIIDDRVKNVIIWVKNNWTAGDLSGDLGNQYECIAFMPKDKFKIKSKRYSNVWYFKRLPANKLLHPTQKPVSIIEHMINISTNENDIVLDCFMGSGTTAIASIRTNRKYIGIELEEEYVNICNERINRENMQMKLW